MGTIVVGVDGSPGSDAALRWALTEAGLRGSQVRVVHVYQAPSGAVGEAAVAGPGLAPAPLSAEEFERLRAAAEREARTVIEEALRRAGADVVAGLENEQAAVEGAPAETLIEAGRGAELLVLGSRGRGGFLGLLLGSVSQQCAQHPPCPVVILPRQRRSSPARAGEQGDDSRACVVLRSCVLISSARHALLA
jgi:nucleotide-binding universal stress UspA family protein